MSLPRRCLIIGDPVAHSLSPRMHSAGYTALGISDQYIFEPQRVTSAELPGFIVSLKTAAIRGAACTMPHKEALVSLVDRIDPMAERIGAINTIVCEGGQVLGYNTDWLGIVSPLKQRTELTGKQVLVVGAGGAARAAIAGMLECGARITITNRTAEKATLLAQRFMIQQLDWKDRCTRPDWDIIINTSSLGMHPQESETPLPEYQFSAHQIVFETIYHPRQTQLLRDAANAQTIRGLEMLLHQGVAQFKLFTGLDGPIEAMRSALE